MGHKLFKTTPDTYPVPFVSGDIFDPEFISESPVVYDKLPTEAPVLSELKSLNPLKGHVSAISVCNFFHLFNEATTVARVSNARQTRNCILLRAKDINLVSWLLL